MTSTNISLKHASQVVSRRSSRYDGIQVLRFVAALLVVITHVTFYTGERLVPGFPEWNAGTAGVDIFFIISGFVMMMSAEKPRTMARGWLHFSMRRIARIVPMYWVVTTFKIATVLIVPSLALNSDLSLWRVVSSYLFIPSQAESGRFEPIVGVGWTLNVEMFFYAIIALALVIRFNPYIFSAAIMSGLAVTGYLLPESGNNGIWSFYTNPIVIYFVVGIVAAKIAFSSKSYILPYLALACAAGAGFFYISGQATWWVGNGFRVLTISAVVLAVISAERWLSGRIPNWLLLLSDASYSIYLIHPIAAPVVPVVMAKLGIVNSGVAIVMGVVVAVASGLVAYVLVEKPLTRWARKLPYASAGSSKNEPALAKDS